ncbi:MAG: 1-acyl-sn-glycerol-3-phosphate acyltransferase [Thermoleophilaceae bacterium]|nr:1-acyl-sn-glycerol-3-phosphate acyltransferase [Thermoleophilaceae bacterium]
MKEQIYLDERSSDEFMKYHVRTRTRKPDYIYQLVRSITTMVLLPLNRVTAIDPQNIPANGAAIFVPNHFSFADHFYIGIYTRRKLQFMAKSQLFAGGLMTYIFTHGGVFPVMRGKNDEEAFETSQAILARGGVVQLYAEGGRSRSDRPAEKAKRGPGKLALESGVPVVPVAVYGSQYMRNIKKGHVPKVIVKYGKPMQFEQTDNPSTEQQLAAAQMIYDRVLVMYGEIEAEYGKQRAS